MGNLNHHLMLFFRKLLVTIQMKLNGMDRENFLNHFSSGRKAPDINLMILLWN